MKGLLALLIIGLIAFCGYNYMQVQELKQEVARLQTKLAEQQQAGATDRVVAEATRALAQAREAISRMDTTTARNYADNARDMLTRASHTAGEKAGPALKWLGEQASDLGGRLQGKR